MDKKLTIQEAKVLPRMFVEATRKNQNFTDLGKHPFRCDDCFYYGGPEYSNSDDWDVFIYCLKGGFILDNYLGTCDLFKFHIDI